MRCLCLHDLFQCVSAVTHNHVFRSECFAQKSPLQQLLLPDCTFWGDGNAISSSGGLLDAGAAFVYCELDKFVRGSCPHAMHLRKSYGRFHEEGV